ncbi:jouberin [Stigmatopora argus]
MPTGESTWKKTQDGSGKTSDRPNKDKLKKKNTQRKDSSELQTLKQRRLKKEAGTDDDDAARRPELGESAAKIDNGAHQEEAPAPAFKSQRKLPSRPLPGESVGSDARRGSKKKAKRKEDDDDKDGDEVDQDGDELLQEYQQQMAPDEESPASEDLGRNKAENRKSATADSDIGYGDQNNAVENGTQEGKKKKKKKSSKSAEWSNAAAKKPVDSDENDGLVLGVYVHRTDGLKTDVRISHPMVKVHVVDDLTGQYVKKRDSHRPVSSFYEQDNVEHILPIMTQPFDFKKNKSVIPEWKEQIIFNEPFSHFVGREPDSPKVILYFEILDFLTMEEAKANLDGAVHERGFRKIAWAFLKPVGANGVLNTGSKVRLQLFVAPTWAKRKPRTIEVVEWWRHYPRVKYASTLYVTVKGIKLPQHVDPSIRSMMALQEERGSTSYGQLQDDVNVTATAIAKDKGVPELTWSRIPGQVCRIPNKPMLVFRGGQMGCLTLLFSHAGTLLAAACADRDMFPVVVFEIPSGKALAAFSGHLKVVYELCWSADDRRLLSVSSDGTVREWDVEQFLPTARKVLPHPSFVYSARYHPAAEHLVVSGGYDRVVRAWRLDVDDFNGLLLREFEAHAGFVNSICFDADGRRMFSADNGGTIVSWNTSLSDDEQQPWRHWSVEKVHAEADLKGVPINMLQVHPNGRCLLIHAKDDVLRTLDLRIMTMIKYTGATNQRERICSTFTPCGNFIFSGSEDGMAYVWNTESGEQVAVYSELSYSSPLCAVAFHPHENMVAFCAFGDSQPVHVYLHDRKASQLESRKTKEPRSESITPDVLYTPALFSTEQLSQATRQTLKMQRVKEQMDSVLEPHGRPSSFEPGRSLFSDISTTRSNASLPPLLGGVSALGLLHRKGTSSHRLHTPLSNNDPTQPVVVTLYDYKADRSDELTLRRGDVVRVLYKDNDNWWYGSRADGQQGYFPVAYVEVQGDSAEEAPLAAAEVERSTPTRISTAMTPSGELRFLSEPALTDTEPELTEAKLKKRKKVKKNTKKPSPGQATFSDPDAGSDRAEGALRPNSRRPLPKRPTAQLDL